MKYTNLKEAKGVLTERETLLNQVFEQAGPADDMNMKNVTCIEGDSAAKVAKIAELNAEMSDIRGDIKSLEDLAKTREDFLELERKNKGVNGGGARRSDMQDSGLDTQGGQQVKSFGDMFIESDAYKQYVGDNPTKGSMPKQSKSSVVGGEYGLKTLFQRTDGWAPEDTRTGRVVPFATRPLEVTDLFPAGRTGQSNVVYMEETLFTNNAAEAAEGAQYAEAALKVEEQSSPVRKIAVFIPVTDEQLEDEQQVSQYLNNRLPFMIRQRLDSQTLVGSGAGVNLTGILNTVGIQTQARGADTSEDAFYKAMVLVQTTGQAMPDSIVVNPTNWQTIRLRKTTDGIYIFGDPSTVGAVTLWGLPVTSAQAITLNTGLVGDFRNFSELTERRGIEVKISDSHDDYFIKGKQAIRADMRVALPIYRPAAFTSVTGLN